MSRMRRLTVVAHWDPDGAVAPHVLRLLDLWAATSQSTILVSTARLTDEARAAANARAEVVERENVGQDFAGWQQILCSRRWTEDHDELILTNDTYVGPLGGVERLLHTVERRRCDFWGPAMSWQVAPHLQSYLLGFTAPVVRSQVFAEFWRTLDPAATRAEAVHEQEIAITRRLVEGGFRAGATFEPTERDRKLAARRRAWWADQMNLNFALEGARQRSADEPVNPSIAYADSALRPDGMPLVKLETLRWDPYFLGSQTLLRECERRWPAEFEGVREYLRRTETAYRGRAGENSAPVERLPEEQAAIGYGALR